MIITRTPMRISLAGGGSDIPEFYSQESGAVVSFAIDKYVYVSINEKFDGRTRVSYSQTENVDDPSELKHELVREALNHFKLKGLEITSVSDIPGEGSGLGSSSSFTVGLVKGLIKYLDGQMNVHPDIFANLAYQIERETRHVGKQDHYAAAYGGLHAYQFNPDESVIAELLPLPKDQIFFLERDLMLFWTGRTRKASPILKDQAERAMNNPIVFKALQLIRDLALQLADNLRYGDFSYFGDILDEGWRLKQSLSLDVTDAGLNETYERAIVAGALGGKILGAGGGGFFLFAVPLENQQAVQNAIGLRRVPFKIVERGSEIIYAGERNE